MKWPPAADALLAAALFGISPPLIQRLGLGRTPLVGSAVLYAGAGVALGAARLTDRLRATPSREAPLRRADLPYVLVGILAGGLLGPVLLLFGLGHTSAGAASLLLNLEMPFTAAIAVLFAGEHLGRREVGAAALVLAGAAWLAWNPSGGHARAALLGSLAVAGACVAWAVDSNVMARIAARDPRMIVASKGLGAALCASLLAWATGAHLPSARALAGGAVVGALSYGLSLLFYVRAQRTLGAARAGALFATAPFVGALASVLLVGERLHASLAGAFALMAAGVALFVAEKHEHAHTHEPLEHEHAHTHDAHHQHAHDGDEGPAPHSHRHRHERLEHAHAHASDAHHRHEH